MALPSGITAIVEKAHLRAPFVWLARLQVQLASDVPPIVFPVTTRAREVTWPPTGPFAETYYPFPFTFGEIRETTEGDLPQVDMSFSNATRVLMDLAYQANGFEGAQVRLVLLHEDSIDDGAEFVRWDFEVQSAKADSSSLTLRLAIRNLFGVKIPSDRFLSNRCRYVFGSKRCGYVINSVAAFTECDKTLAACRARGDDEVARNLPRLHPVRWGGFLGIPVQRR